MCNLKCVILKLMLDDININHLLSSEPVKDKLY